MYIVRFIVILVIIYAAIWIIVRAVRLWERFNPPKPHLHWEGFRGEGCSCAACQDAGVKRRETEYADAHIHVIDGPPRK